jgi:hypothetical protein
VLELDRDVRPSRSPRPVFAGSRMRSSNLVQSRWRTQPRKRARF